MASGSSAPSAPKRGRPKRGFETRRISLKESVFDYWNAKKGIFGYSNKTHSEFAEYLLEAVDDQMAGKDGTLTASPNLHDKCIVLNYICSLVFVLCKYTGLVFQRSEVRFPNVARHILIFQSALCMYKYSE